MTFFQNLVDKRYSQYGEIVCQGETEGGVKIN